MREVALLPAEIEKVKRLQALTFSPGASTDYDRVRYERVIPSGFDAASDRLMHWAPQRSVFRVRTTCTQVRPGAIVEMSLGPCLGPARFYCRVTDVVDEPDRRGFSYGTLPGHPESGEESFLVERRGSGQVVFVIEAVSRPSNLFWRAVRPLLDAARRVITTRRYLTALD
ncbi:DUF1990 family protein [Corynebacterium sp. UBA2622]|uniref:DUF1990 family protein n=1 Tax=Corynebacterium sp. UBA2622 TaxID=1946393 RepID=UPI0025B8D394|nr:DUF1990 domain-containing protein [Corynebacterium sp. UBA2622]